MAMTTIIKDHSAGGIGQKEDYSFAMEKERENFQSMFLGHLNLKRHKKV